MGVLARILLFPNAEVKYKMFKVIENAAKEGQMVEYDRIRLYNKEYDLNLIIRLLFRVTLQSVLLSSDISNIYKIEVDVPVEHRSLEGEFRVKEVRDAYLVHPKASQNDHPAIERIAVIATEHSSSTITCALKALQKLGFTAVEGFIELPQGTRAIDVLKELGNIGWVFISDVRDTHLKGAGLYGNKLQYSEVLMDLASRGGRIKAAIIEHSARDVRIILSERGTIYSPKIVDYGTLARMVKEIASVLFKHNLVKMMRI
jgi:hypothetical protein